MARSAREVGVNRTFVSLKIIGALLVLSFAVVPKGGKPMCENPPVPVKKRSVLLSALGFDAEPLAEGRKG